MEPLEGGCPAARRHPVAALSLVVGIEAALITQTSCGLSAVSTVSVVAGRAGGVGGYDRSIELTGLDLQIPRSTL